MAAHRKALASAAILAALVGPPAAHAQPAPSTLAAPIRPAAVVNGEPVPEGVVEACLRSMPPSAGPLHAAGQRERRQAALDQVIDETLVRQFLSKSAPAIPDADVEKEIANLKKSLAERHSTLEEYLRGLGQGEAELRAGVAAQLQWKTYLTARLTDSVLKLYYDANKPFFDKVLVRASHILLRVPATATPAERQEAQQRLLALVQEIIRGKTGFPEAARKYSDCPSKEHGGDL